MVDREKKTGSADDLEVRLDSHPRVLFSTPKSEPNLGSSFLFPKVGNDGSEHESKRTEKPNSIIFGAVSAFK